MLAQSKRLELDGDGVPFPRLMAAQHEGRRPTGVRLVSDALIELSAPPRARTVVATLHDAGARSA